MRHFAQFQPFATAAHDSAFALEICSLVACVPFLVLHKEKGCGGFKSWAFNATFNVTLLLLFADFSRRNYSAKCVGAQLDV